MPVICLHAFRCDEATIIDGAGPQEACQVQLISRYQHLHALHGTKRRSSAPRKLASLLELQAWADSQCVQAFDRGMQHLDKAFGFLSSPHEYISRKVPHTRSTVAVHNAVCMFERHMFHPSIATCCQRHAAAACRLAPAVPSVRWQLSRRLAAHRAWLPSSHGVV